MATCQIRWKPSALRELKRIDRQVIPRIIQSIERLAEDPFAGDVRKLQGAEHTYRVGEYRVVYEVVASKLTVVIVRVRHRKDAYRR